jgi:hypothetical protein
MPRERRAIKRDEHQTRAVKRSLHDSHLSYSIADSPRLDAMGEPGLRAYRLLIVPGGNFEQIGHA